MSEKTLEERLAALERLEERNKAYKDCLELIVKYQIHHHPMTAMGKADLFALTMPDVSMEVSQWGKYVGRDAIIAMQRIFSTAPLNGVMWNHHVDSPIIEIAGDGKTARGLFFSPGTEAHRELNTDGEVHAYWCFGKYTVDFIKENGVWKIWHLHWWRLVRNSFDRSWVEDAKTTLTKAPWAGQKNVENMVPKGLVPTEFFQYYMPDKVTPCIPWYPTPYETWDDGVGEDWVYGPWKEQFVHAKPYEEDPVFNVETVDVNGKAVKVVRYKNEK